MLHLGVAFGGDSIKRSRILSESPRVHIQKLHLGGFVYNVNYNGVYSENIIITITNESFKERYDEIMSRETDSKFLEPEFARKKGSEYSWLSALP